MMSVNLVHDDGLITVEKLKQQASARILPIDEILPILASPDSRLPLVRNGGHLSDGVNLYEMRGNSAILYPEYVVQRNMTLELDYYEDPKLQYFLIAQIKQRGAVNSNPTDIHYQKHLHRMRKLLAPCQGLVLDVGCDDVSVSRALVGDDCAYIGLDPFSGSNDHPRLVGMAEFLPVADASVDNVIFNTSLDHIQDYFRAIQEAHRVLRKGGRIWISTLLWNRDAELYRDSVHFHHFKDYEIDGALKAFGFLEKERVTYSYKADTHRYGLYLSAQKM